MRTGGMLKVMRDRGYEQVIGYDPSPGCSVAGRRLYNVEVRTKTLADLASENERFDLVTSTGVIEHVCDVDVAMTAISHLVADGGLAFIGVPDATQFHKWPNAPFQEFSTEHINFFSPGSLNNLMQVHGFELVSSTTIKRGTKPPGGGAFSPVPIP